MSESAAAGHPYYFEVTDWKNPAGVDTTSTANPIVELLEISPTGAADLLRDPLVRSTITNPATHADDGHADTILELYGYGDKLATAVKGLLVVTRDGMDLHFQSGIHDPRSVDGKNHERLLRSFEQNKKRREPTGMRKIIPLLLGWSEVKKQKKAQENTQALRDTAIQLLGSASLARADAQRSAWQEHKLSPVPNDPALMRLLTS